MGAKKKVAWVETLPVLRGIQVDKGVLKPPHYEAAIWAVRLQSLPQEMAQVAAFAPSKRVAEPRAVAPNHGERHRE